MGLRDIFKKAYNKEESLWPELLSACAKGKLIPLSEVKDEAFASEALGKGYGVIPESGEIFAPVDGSVEMVFPTRHALGLKTRNGTEVLIHIGINTVEENGEGFECLIKQGDQVTKGQLLERFDLKGIIQKGYDPTVMLIITNTAEYKRVALENGSLVVER